MSSISIKRSLKDSEIEYIIDFIKANPSIPTDISSSILKRNREKVIAQLKTIKIYPEMIEDLKKTLFKQYHTTLCAAGESVGIITAQSIGERQTQNTLNSVVYEEKILLEGNNGALVVKIGEFIDYFMNNNITVEKYENGQEYLDIKSLGFRVPSVDEDGKTSWERVLAITRHPGKIIQVRTRTGRTVVASTGKSFLVRRDFKLVPTDGSDLRIGDKIPIVLTFPSPLERITSFNGFNLDTGFAAFISNCILKCYKIDGDTLILPRIMDDYEFNNDLLTFLDKYEYSTNDYIIQIKSPVLCKFIEKYCEKSLPDFIFTANKVFMKNLIIIISTIYGNRFIKDEDFIERYLHLLSQVNGLYKKTECGGWYIVEKINEIDALNDVHMDEVIDIVQKEMTHPYLYDLTVENTKNFVLFSGIGVRDTFHNTGLVVKTVVTGVPRFSELINATHEPKAPSCSIYFNKHKDMIGNLKKVINHTIREITFGDLVIESKCGKNLPQNDWYDEYDLLYGEDYKKYEWSIQLKLNLELLFDYRITLNKVVKKLMSEYSDITCIFSPEYIGEIHIFVDVSEIENDEELYDELDDAYSAYVEEIVLPSIKTVQLFGIKGIKNIFYEKRGNEWMLDTEGSNFQEVLAHPEVDKVRTVSNNMWEIYETLGIEAARNFLIEEFAAIVSSDGTFVNDSHIMLLVDIMTFSGSIISISRYGMKKENCGPMAKASFEESLDNFLKAGAFGEKESTNGVSASIMLGKLAKFGTGICDVIVDIAKLPNRPDVIRNQVVEKSPETPAFKRSPKIGRTIRF